MNALIIHDRSDVGEEIRAIAECFSEGAAVILVEDAATARAHLAQEYFDVLIIDLTIPIAPQSVGRGFQVAEGLLEEIFQAPHLLTPGNIVGITQDESALYGVQNTIGQHLMAVLAEDIDGRWRTQLSDRLSYIASSTNARTLSLLRRHDLDLLIITALDKELTPYREFFELNEVLNFEGLKDFAFTDKNGVVRRGACYAIGRAGQASAASETQGLLCRLRPRLAIMSGFCGGVPNKAELGDIVFADAAFDWDYGKWKPTENANKLYAKPEPVVIRNSRTHRLARELAEHGFIGNDELNEKVLDLSSGEISSPSIKIGPFASGSAVISADDVRDSLLALNDNICGVDMEAFGFYFSARFAHAAPPEFICVKSVADDCGPLKDDRLHVTCSFASAFVVKMIATRHWDF